MGSANCCSREPEDQGQTFHLGASHDDKIAMVIKIQKVFRGFLARKRVGAMRATMVSRNFVMSEGEVVKLSDNDVYVSQPAHSLPRNSSRRSWKWSRSLTTQYAS